MSPRVKYAAALIASLYAAYYASTTHSWHFIDGVDLLIHEAGHWIFLPFGELMHVLMGSGLQILLPTVFVAYFWRNRARWSASLTLFWVGCNILNVAVYAGDAVKEQLPLLGNGEHDWHWLFGTMGVLPYTDTIAGAMFAVGIATLAAASVGSFYYIDWS